MIRENYGNVSGSSESGSGGSSSSGLNEQQVISLINSQTVQNFTNNFNSSDFNSFTNLNNWVNNKVNTIIENPVEEVYNRIRSDLYDKQITHTPINNICFTVTYNTSIGTRTRRFFNTNNLVFEAMVTKPYNEGIQVKRGDVLVVFYKTQFGDNYIINNMMLIIGGLNMTSSGITLSKPFNSSGNVTYFRANPFTAYYTSPLPSSTDVNYNMSIELRTNANCINNNTDIVNLNYNPSKINYYFLWSGNNDPSDTSYIDFTNIFKTDVTTYNIMLSKASDISVLDLSQLSNESSARVQFNSVGQTNGIQNEIINMFSNKDILNDLRKVSNLFQTYSLQSIYTANLRDSYYTKLEINTSKNPVKSDIQSSETRVYIMFLVDFGGSVVGIDLVYCPANCPIRDPSTKTGTISTGTYYQCNNIFNTDNDLFLSFTGCMNLNRNLTFTINFMDIRSSEYSTHLILYSKKLSLTNLYNQFNTTRMYIAKYMLFNFNYLNTNCYHVNLDDYLEQKQGTIMDTPESDNIRISFDKLI